MQNNEIEVLVQAARESLSDFCINTCKAQCCKRGKILVDNPQLQLLLGNRATTRPDGFKEMILQPSCRFLSTESKCTLYKNQARPKICGDYPLFLRGNTLQVSSVCKAVQEKQLDDYLDLLKNKHVKITIL